MEERQDLISRDFIKSLGGECIAARDSKTHELLPISSIDALPSAHPELIMCKDCKFADGEATTSNGMYWCIVHGTYMRYCSDAKRRTDVDMRGEQDAD